MGSLFNLGATQSDSDGTQDGIPSDSDFEHLNMNAGAEAPQALHSWYGRQVLRLHLASDVAKRASIFTPAARLDVSQPHRYYLVHI